MRTKKRQKKNISFHCLFLFYFHFLFYENALLPVERLLLSESPFFIFCVEIFNLRKGLRA